MIPLAQVFALEFTSPIWVILLSPLVLGEKLTRARLFAAGMGFIGILLVARPDFTALDPGVLAAAASALCFAATNLMTKKLTQGESIVSILFWLTLMQGVFGLVMAGHDGVIQLPTAATLPWLAVIGFCGAAGASLHHHRPVAGPCKLCDPDRFCPPAGDRVGGGVAVCRTA